MTVSTVPRGGHWLAATPAERAAATSAEPGTVTRVVRSHRVDALDRPVRSDNDVERPALGGPRRHDVPHGAVWPALDTDRLDRRPRDLARRSATGARSSSKSICRRPNVCPCAPSSVGPGASSSPSRKTYGTAAVAFVDRHEDVRQLGRRRDLEELLRPAEFRLDRLDRPPQIDGHGGRARRIPVRCRHGGIARRPSTDVPAGSPPPESPSLEHPTSATAPTAPASTIARVQPARVSDRDPLPHGQVSMTTGTIIGRRLVRSLTNLPAARRTSRSSASTSRTPLPNDFSTASAIVSQASSSRSSASGA